MDNSLSLLILGAMIATFLLVVGLTMPTRSNSSSGDATLEEAVGSNRQYRARSLTGTPLLVPLTRSAVRRSAKNDAQNANYLKLLKQANWYWAPGEAVPPVRSAPFWNLETLWGEKYAKGVIFGGTAFAVVVVLGVIFAPIFFGFDWRPGIIAAFVLGGALYMMGYGDPDGQLAGAAANRQRELSLEMGFRIAELRSDVLAGYTIQRAIRNMATKPGGPFIEELRRIVAVLNTSKDDTVAMDVFMDRNTGSEIVQEFANQIKMVTREGGEIAPALNVLTDAAQNRLRQQIMMQGRKNLQDMSRPVGLVSLLVTFMLLVIPVVYSIITSLNTFG
jgi:hypothetical protein